MHASVLLVAEVVGTGVLALGGDMTHLGSVHHICKGKTNCILTQIFFLNGCCVFVCLWLVVHKYATKIYSWVGGIIALVACTCLNAVAGEYLWRIACSHPAVTSYSDIAGLLFGPLQQVRESIYVFMFIN